MGTRLTAPPSKSYAIRALAASFLAGPRPSSPAAAPPAGTTTLHNLGTCDDVRAAQGCVEALRRGGERIFAGESALTARLFAPIVSVLYGDGAVEIETSGSLRDRPTQKVDLTGEVVTVDGSISSQFVSGLLMALPISISKNYRLLITNPVSTPYIDMTLEVMERFGIYVNRLSINEFQIPGDQRYVPTDYTVEGDWSAVAQLIVAQKVTGKKVMIEGLNPESLQPDRSIMQLIDTEGVISFDATNCPDLIPSLVPLCAVRQGVSKISGAQRLVHKESNRAVALQEEFAKIGVTVHWEGDFLYIHGCPSAIHGGVVSSHNDHRIAMALGVASLATKEPVTILGSNCVSKSYPKFWEDLEKFRGDA